MKNAYLLLTTTFLALFPFAASAQTIITFDETVTLQSDNSVIWQSGDALPAAIDGPFSTQGFDFTISNDNNAEIEAGGDPGNRFNDGGFGRTTTITESNGQAFSLNSLDLEQNGVGSVADVFITGTYEAGGTISGLLTMASPANTDWQTFLIDGSFSGTTTSGSSTDWSGLSSVSFNFGGTGANTRNAFYDNVSVTVVPEPGTVALLVGALGVLLITRRRCRA